MVWVFGDMLKLEEPELAIWSHPTRWAGSDSLKEFIMDAKNEFLGISGRHEQGLEARECKLAGMYYCPAHVRCY